MALGAAFFAANMSRNYQVKNVHLYEDLNYQINLEIKNLYKQDDQDIYYKKILFFDSDTHIGKKKNIALTYHKDLQFTFSIVNHSKIENNTIFLIYNFTRITYASRVLLN